MTGSTNPHLRNTGRRGQGDGHSQWAVGFLPTLRVSVGPLHKAAGVFPDGAGGSEAPSRFMVTMVL